MNQRQFAALIGTNQSTVSAWKQKGWLVFSAPGVIDPDASKALLIEKRGQAGPMTPQQIRRSSSWSRSPHCETYRAFECQRRFKA